MNKIEELLFNIDIPKPKVSTGSLLISEPFLRESYFNHAVICIVDYEKGGKSMGLVLNKRTNYVLSDLISSIKSDEPIPIYCGGPVSCDRLFFVHTLGDIIPGAKEISPGLYIGGSFTAMIDYVNSGYLVDGMIRFCLGYSGWDEGQLDDELSQNVWTVATISNTEGLFSGSDDSYWHQFVRKLGERFRGWRYHPQNPRFN
jgi:putative transcriptional regulator